VFTRCPFLSEERCDEWTIQLRREYGSSGEQGGSAWRRYAGVCAIFATGRGQYQASTPVIPGTPAAAVSFCQSTEAGCAANGSSQVSGTRNLDLVIEWRNLPAGAHSQKVSFVLPSGEEYQAFERSFEVPDGSSDSVTSSHFRLQARGSRREDASGCGR